MPQKTYKLKSPSGKEYSVDWTKPTDPTDDDFRNIISELSKKEQVEQPKITTPVKEEKSLWDKIFSPVESVVAPMRRDAMILSDPNFQARTRKIPIVGKPLAEAFNIASGALGGGPTGVPSLQDTMTPFNAATTVLPALRGVAAARGIPALWNAANIADKTAGLAMLGRGTQTVFSSEDPLQAVEGLLGMVMGVAGMKTPGRATGTTKSAFGPQVAPEVPTGPKLLGPGTGFAPEVTNPPARFISGSAGIADTKTPYLYDWADPAKQKLQDISLGPKEEFIGSPTVLPQEIAPGFGRIPSSFAAEGGLPVSPGRIGPEGLEESEIRSILGSSKEDKIYPGASLYQGPRKRGAAFDRPKEEEITPFDEPQFARTETGGVKIGADIQSLGKVLGSSLYSGNIGKVVTKELLQNSLDAVRSLGTSGNVDVYLDMDSSKGNTVRVVDNGLGLTRKELETVFTDLGASGKRSDQSAIGGFGLAKAAPLLGGEHAKIVTVAREEIKPGEWRLVKHSFEGTPDELLSGVKITSRVMPNNIPTGTSVTTRLPKESNYLGYAEDFVKDLVSQSPNIKGNVNFFDGKEYTGGYDPITSELAYKPRKIELTSASKRQYDITILSDPIADVDIMIPQDTAYHEGIPAYSILNQGMYQGKVSQGFRSVPGIPKEVLVNIKSKVEEGHPDYPWTANREKLRGKIESLVDEYIENTIINPAIGRRAKTLRDIYDNMPEIPIPALGSKKFHLYNVANRITPEEIKNFSNNTTMLEMATHISDVLHDVLHYGGLPEWDRRLQKIGFIFDNSLHGIHIPSPGKDVSAILINPFVAIRKGTPDQAGASFFHTISHEIAHIPGGGHDESFTVRLAEIYSKYGAERAIENQQRFVNAITKPGGQEYTDEIHELLQWYNEVQGSGSSEKDPLLGTGIKQSNSGSEGEGKIPRGSGAGGGNPITELQRALNESIGKRKAQEELYSKERSSRLGKTFGVKTPGMKGFYEQLGKLKGPLPKVTPEPLNISAKQADELINLVTANPTLRGYEKIRAKAALAKMWTGAGVPQEKEIDLLRKVFGNFVGEQIVLLYGGLGAVGLPEGTKPLHEIANFSRTIMSSLDLSAPFRQGLALSNRSEFWYSFTDMFKSFGDEGAYNAVMETIKSNPYYDLAIESGIRFTDLGDYANREEQFHSKLAEKIPGVRASNRAYVAFLNKIRMDVFAKLAEESKLAMMDEGPNNPILSQALAKYINDASGRGSFGRKLDPAMTALNDFFFSPRLIASRVNFLNPITYYQADPVIRKQYLRSLLAIATVGTIVTQLGKATGGDVELNPRSSDFMKVKFGSTRLDPWGGFQQYIVAATRLITGESKSSTTGHEFELGKKYGSPTRLDVAGRFGESKLHPVGNFITTLLRGKNFQGAPVNVKEEISNRVIPMLLQDLYDLGMEDPQLFPLGILAALGMGLQTYRRPDANQFVGGER